MLYWLLMIDVSIFSMRVSAFSLVCFQVLVEFWLYLRLGGNTDTNIQKQSKHTTTSKNIQTLQQLGHSLAVSDSFYPGLG